jgi:hypothetical protein
MIFDTPKAITSLASSEWGPAKKIAFRFFFIFFTLFIIIENNGAYPGWQYLMMYPTELMHALVPWIGKHVLNLSYDITVFTNGSGDTTYDWVIVLTITVMALTGAMVWSVFDRSRPNYDTMYYWLTVGIRYYVALTLINYGMIKVIQLQFPPPSLDRLTQTYGESSPMGLAWTFLGFSRGYNLFMGLAEISAVLLLFRRTMTIGCIITLMTTANVMAVNYFFDVPVKIVSTALVSMTLFLLMRDADRLFNFFFTGRATALPEIKTPELTPSWIRPAGLVVKSVLIGYVLIFGFIQKLSWQKAYGDRTPKPELHGIYDVETFVKNNDTIPASTTDGTRWKQFIVEQQGSARSNNIFDGASYYTTELDATSRRLTLRVNDDVLYSLHYDIPEAGRLLFRGIGRGDSVLIGMVRKEVARSELLDRGFHWVNEYPYYK